MKKNYPSKHRHKDQASVQVKPASAEIQPVGRSVRMNQTRMAAWIIGLLAVAIYANTLTLDYVLDDRLMITENQFTKQGIKGIGEIFSNDAFTGFYGKQKKLVAGGRYRPLSQVVFALEYQFFGLSPFIGHLLNLAFYAFTCVFLFFLLKKLLIKTIHPPWYLSVPFIAVVFFTAHPIHTEVVANIKGLDEIMCFLGCLGALFYTIKYLESNKPRQLIWLFLCFFLALLAKESAITFLVVIPLTCYFFRKPSKKNYLSMCMTLFLAFVPYLLLRYNALGFLLSGNPVTELLNNPYVYATATEKSATIIYTWGKYIWLLFVPHPLTHDYYPKQIALLNWQDIRVIISFAGCVFLVVYALLKSGKKSLTSFGILFSMVTFSISSNLFFNVGTFMNERFMFVPSLGFVLVIAWLAGSKLPKLFSRPKQYQQVTSGLLILILILYSAKTFTRNFAWKDDFTLFTTDVKVSSNSAKCNVSAGGMCLEKAVLEKDEMTKKRLLEKAEGYLTKGVSIYPGYAAGWVLRGNVMLELKNYDLARLYYDNCLRIYHDQPEATNKLFYLGQILTRDKNFALALQCFQTLYRFNPEKSDNEYHLADAYANANRADTAIVILQNLIEKHPEYALGYSKLGEIYGRYLNDLDKSLVFLHKAVSMDPKDLSANENLGIVYGMKKDFRTSIAFFQKALDIDSTVARIYVNIGNTYSLMGQKAMAARYFDKARLLQKSVKNP